jgi:DNA-binding NarL/FixJ family response regulator
MLKSGPNPTLAPIIFMTGLSEREHVVKGLEAGGVDYITKPVVIEEMIARLTTHLVNSRLLQSARLAIDAFDQSVLAFDAEGALVWASQKALEVVEGQAGLSSSIRLRTWVSACVDQPVSSVTPFEDGPLVFQFIGFSAAREVLVKLVQQSEHSNEDILRHAFGLTTREAEVLYWLTLGKTNRDISAILALSARTVNKHLEQVFQKMGVDNRTSAAVLADRRLSLVS